jgi:hypothetical protein
MWSDIVLFTTKHEEALSIVCPASTIRIVGSNIAPMHHQLYEELTLHRDFGFSNCEVSFSHEEKLATFNIGFSV